MTKVYNCVIMLWRCVLFSLDWTKLKYQFVSIMSFLTFFLDAKDHTSIFIGMNPCFCLFVFQNSKQQMFFHHNKKVYNSLLKDHFYPNATDEMFGC